jgi:dTDP-4-dehydrorhamnose reductase
VRASGANYAILRTSWVFSAHGKNFVKTMIRLAETRDALRIVNDQYGGPTPACEIAAACLSIAAQLQSDPEKRGTYHFSGTPDVAWKEFAEAIFEASGQKISVTGLPTSQYPTPAKRPTNSRLDCRTTTAVFDLPRPDWKIALKTVLADLEMSTETGLKDTL